MNITKPRLDQFKITGSTVGDVYFPKVAALLPFDGTNGATSTSDLSNRSGGVSFAGTAQISTAQSKFGGSSLLLDGNSDYLTISDSYWASAMDSGDWTVEFWVRFAALGSNEELVGNRGNTGGNSSNGWALRKTTSNNIILYWYEGGQFNYLNNSQGSQTTLSADTWYHVAVTRSGNVWRLFLNGTQEDTVTDSGTIVSSNENRLFIGNFGTNYLNGYMDDLRITVGQARYTSNFTAPTSAHLTSAGDVNKHIVVNSDADGVAIGTGGINQARIAKAWADIDGSQTAANQIESSYNISSMTDHGSAQFSFNFATAMTDADYSVVGGLGIDGGAATSVAALLIKDKTTALVKMHARYVAGDGTSTDYDYNIICMQVFGN
jgi:hypothetical protein